MNDKAAVQRLGLRVAELTALQIGDTECEAITTTWQQENGPLSVEANALYKCATSMAAVQTLTGHGGGDAGIVFQINRVQLELPTE